MKTALNVSDATMEAEPDHEAIVVRHPAAGVPHEIATRRAWIAYASICLLWGTTFLGIRVAIETIPTLLVPALRFLGAGAILFVIALATRAKFPATAREWRDQAVAGILMSAVGNTLVVWAEHSITSGMAALLAATIPIWMTILEAILGEARITRRKVAGLALGFGGVAVLVAPAIGAPDISLKFFLGVGAMQLSAIAWNCGTLYSKKRRAGGDAMALASIQMLAGGTAIGTVALLFGPHDAGPFSARSVGALLYLMIFGSVIAYTAFMYALPRLGAGKLSSYAYVNPAVAVVVGAIVLHETVTLRIFVAMAVILAGVALIQLEKRIVR